MMETRWHGQLAGMAGLAALIGGISPAFAQTLATGGGIGLSAVVAPANENSKLEVVRPLTASQGVASVANLPGSIGGGGAGMDLPKVFAPTKPRTRYTRYPWKTNIMTTVFWVGELPTPRNPTPNTKSAWDQQWVKNFGGYDDPDLDSRNGFRPKEFEPGQNPFYIALPYNDLQRGGGTKTSARHVIPWFDREFVQPGKTIIKGRWLAIRLGSKVCYAQWEDVGPFETDDWQYVFGDARPKTKGNKGAGLDVSPAVRDYLGMTTMGHCDWRFVDEEEVPDGPWKKWGENNPFSKAGGSPGEGSPVDPDRILKIREMADRYLDETARADQQAVAAE
jgi:hypothetical protein